MRKGIPIYLPSHFMEKPVDQVYPRGCGIGESELKPVLLGSAA